MITFDEYGIIHDDKKVLPDFYAIKLDETDMWRKDIQQKAGKIYGIYLIDFSRIFHICSLSGSYEAYFLQNFVCAEGLENFSEDELMEIEHDTFDEPVQYFPESITNHIVEKEYLNDVVNESELYEAMESEEKYEEIKEEIFEYIKGNTPF